MTSRHVAGLAAAVGVAGCIGSLFVARDAAIPVEPAMPRPTSVPVGQVSLACPGGMSQLPTAASVLAAAPDLGGRATTGPLVPATVRELGGGESFGRLDARGTSVTSEIGSGSVGISAVGSLAAGLAGAEWATPAGDEAGNGLAVARCAAAADEWWFNGVDTSVGADSRLVLSNPTRAVAVVDLAFLGPSGAVETLGARGIALAPDASSTIDLARFAPDLDSVTMSVRATQGRVVAAVGSVERSGDAPAALEWIAPSSPPARSVVIGPCSPGAGSQQLVIANPSPDEALIKVEILDPTGPFVPSGYDALRVPPTSVLTSDITAIADGSAVSARLTSNVPVTGGMVTVKAGPLSDFALSSAAAALTDPAMVPVVPDASLSLVLASGASSLSRVRVTAYSSAGEIVSAARVVVEGSTATKWELPDTNEAAYVVVGFDPSLPPNDVAAADLHGVAQYRGDDGIASIPLVSGVFNVTRPGVVPEPP